MSLSQSGSKRDLIDYVYSLVLWQFPAVAIFLFSPVASRRRVFFFRGVKIGNLPQRSRGNFFATPRCTQDPACVFGLCLTHKFTSSWQKQADYPSPPLVPEGVFARRKRQRSRSHLTLHLPSEAKWTERFSLLSCKDEIGCTEGDSNAVGPTTSETTISARCGASWKPGVGRLIRRRIRMRYRLVMSFRNFSNIVGREKKRVRMRNPSTAQLFTTFHTAISVFVRRR